jgi:hypothetical protein
MELLLGCDTRLEDICADAHHFRNLLSAILFLSLSADHYRLAWLQERDCSVSEPVLYTRLSGLLIDPRLKAHDGPSLYCGLLLLHFGWMDYRQEWAEGYLYDRMQHLGVSCPLLHKFVSAPPCVMLHPPSTSKAQRRLPVMSSIRHVPQFTVPLFLTRQPGMHVAGRLSHGWLQL